MGQLILNVNSNSLRRVIVVGHTPYFGLHMPSSHDGVAVRHVEFYHNVSNRVFNLLEYFKPEVLLAYRPELLPISVLNAFSGVKIGFSSEIFPKLIDGKVIADKSHMKKFEFFDNSATRKYDLMYHYDISSKEFLESQNVRIDGYPPYPLSDELFQVSSAERDIDILFIGRVSPRRYHLIEPFKRKNMRFVSIDHGFYGAELLNLLRRTKVLLNIHAENHVSFEPRTLIGAAVGAVVVTEPLSIPAWLSDSPFVFTDPLCTNLVARVDEVLRDIKIHQEKASSFQRKLKNLCSADKFLDRCLEAAAATPKLTSKIQA